MLINVCDWNTVTGTPPPPPRTICLYLRDLYPVNGAHLIFNHLGAMSSVHLVTIVSICISVNWTMDIHGVANSLAFVKQAWQTLKKKLNKNFLQVLSYRPKCRPWRGGGLFLKSQKRNNCTVHNTFYMNYEEKKEKRRHRRRDKEKGE